MKICLIALLIVGGLWLTELSFRRFVDPAFALDAFIPPKVLAASSPEERAQMQEELRRFLAPSYLSWTGALLVVLCSSVALKLIPKKEPIQPPETTRGK
jgi:hypothetical protein